MWVQVKVTIFNALFALFLFAGLWTNRNFFKYVFGKTFHYTEEGWRLFTKSFAWFFILTAVLNEVVRLSFIDTANVQRARPHRCPASISGSRSRSC